MGLAGTKVKQRFGMDPRNTKWANNTNRFGHQYMEKQGWKPGSGLGLVSHAMTTHVKIAFKEDNVGLGAKLAKKTKKDEFDSGECAGLDVFQRILGRLNGKEEEINKELDLQKQEKILGKMGITFVKGDVLRSTWDKEAKKLIDNSKKRSRDESEDESEASEEEKPKKAKKEKKEKSKDKKEKKEKKDKKDKKEKKEKSEDKKDKKDKKEKKEKSKDKKEKKEKKDKKDKKEKSKDEDKSSEVTRESMLTPTESRESTPVNSRHIRSRWIKQKRAATLDAKALNEIFMITN